jgi:acyl carrier protein
MQIDQQKLAEEIRKIVSEKVLLTNDPGTVDDQTIASLDSIGRLTLLVELENMLGVELMGDELRPETFSSMEKLTEYIAQRVAKTG